MTGTNCDLFTRNLSRSYLKHLVFTHGKFFLNSLYPNEQFAHRKSKTFSQYFFSLAQQPNANQGRLISEICRSHTMTRHSRWDSSGRGIGPSQRPLPDNTQHSQATSMPPAGFFLSSYTLLLLHPFLFLCPDCPAFCLLSLLTTHNTTQHTHPCPRQDFLKFSLLICITSLSWLSWLCLLSLLCNTHNTNIHAPAGFEPATPASDRPQTIAFDRLDAGIVTQQKL